MAFSVTTNNRFDLFVDEDEEPEEFVSKQHQQAVTDRQRKDSDRKSAKVTADSRQVPGKAQTQPTVVKPTSNVSGTAKATSSSGNGMTQVTRAKRDVKRTTVEPANVSQSQQPSPRQDLTFRERSEPGKDFRGSQSSTSRRGRGVTRGNFTPGSDGGFDRFGKREFERRSGSDKTGLKPVEKRSGGGAHNWGSITDAVLDAEDAEAGTTANVTGVTATQALDEEEATAAVRQLTLDEWRALQADTRPPTNFNIRRPGEGCTSDPRWNKMHLLKKKHNDDDEDISGQFDDADEETSRSQKSVVQIPVTFADSDRHSGRGRGRGSNTQQQKVEMSRQQQPMTLNDLVPNVDSEQDFPSLS